MKTLAGLIPLVALLLLGCHKNSSPPAVSAPVTEQAPGEAQPVPAAPPAVAAKAENVTRENVTGEVNEFLTRQLRIFIQEKNRVPKSFAEFAGARLDGVPRPPQGTKWVIDNASQEVKSVAVK